MRAFYNQHLQAFYDLRLWFDGQPHHLVPGVDFQGSRQSIRAFLYRQAIEYGFMLRTRSQDDGGLSIQAYNRDGTPISF